MTTTLAPPNIDHRRERRNLVRHFFEMIAAMLVGMVMLGLVAQGVCAALGHPGALQDHAALRAPVMAVNMVIGMAVWMRYRGHGWGAIAEMSCAMLVPLVVLILPFFAGVISADALLVGMHALMLPAMVVAMLHRRDEYAQDHRHRTQHGT